MMAWSGLLNNIGLGNNMENMEEFNGYIVNIPEVVKDKKSLYLTRLLAAQIRDDNYMTVGEFFKNLGDNDVEQLLEYSNMDTDKQVEQLLIITMMLITAEGLDNANDMETARKHLSQLVSFIALESLYRKGLIKLYHENMSFDESENKIVAEKL
jgi:hypothetical protein